MNLRKWKFWSGVFLLLFSLVLWVFGVGYNWQRGKKHKAQRIMAPAGVTLVVGVSLILQGRGRDD